nr:helix-turn-helix transcriptional regulator [Spelaeicoccus albus]
MFELLWTAATPLPRSGRADSADPSIDRDVLLYLASGATDGMIARHLNVSPRTAQRRVRALMESLGAGSRFQAGIQAARRKLL